MKTHLWVKCVGDLKDCSVFGVEVQWVSGKWSWERPWKHCFRAVYQVLDHWGYKLYIIISLFRILFRKKIINLSFALQNLPIKTGTNDFIFFLRQLIGLPDLRGCFLSTWIVRTNFSSTVLEWTNSYSSWMKSQEKDSLKH